jgi:hypothetical protein
MEAAQFNSALRLTEAGKAGIGPKLKPEIAYKRTVEKASTNNVTGLANLRPSAQSPKVVVPRWLPEIVKVESLRDTVFIVRNLQVWRRPCWSLFALLLAHGAFLGFFSLFLLSGTLFLTLIERWTRISCHEAPSA